MARRRKDTLGKTYHAILSADGTTLKETGHGKGPALLLAQKMAEAAPGPTRLTVELRTLFGTPITLYRVERREKEVYTSVVEDAD